MEVRRATPDDAPAMADAHVDSIRSLGPPSYSTAVVDAWAAAVTPSMYVQAMAAGEAFFIALGPVDGRTAVLGFASHNPAGGDDGASCYVRGAAARQGIGSRLWRLAETHARDSGATSITVQASLGGVPFYRAHGFEEIGRDEACLHTGAVMPCVIMRKPLTGPAAG